MVSVAYHITYLRITEDFLDITLKIFSVVQITSKNQTLLIEGLLIDEEPISLDRFFTRFFVF